MVLLPKNCDQLGNFKSCNLSKTECQIKVLNAKFQIDVADCHYEKSKFLRLHE